MIEMDWIGFRQFLQSIVAGDDGSMEAGDCTFKLVNPNFQKT